MVFPVACVKVVDQAPPAPAAPTGNLPPVIASLTAAQNQTYPGGTVNLQSVVSDPNGDMINFKWTATGGEFVENGRANTTWRAPKEFGSYEIKLTVDDGKGGTAQSTAQITVSANHPPTITSLTADPAALQFASRTTLTCIASDQDGDSVQYSWQATDGTLSGEGNKVSWTSPSKGGNYSVFVVVGDGKGAETRQEIVIPVAAPSGVQTFTMIPKESGTVTSDGDRDNTIFKAGDDEKNIGYRAFFSYNIFREAVSKTMDIARKANRFLTQNEPWKLIKTDRDTAAKIMSVSLNLCHTLALLFYPVIPETSNRIHAMLGFDGTIESLINRGVSIWDMAKKPGLKKGHRLHGNSEILFTKIEDADIAPELAKIEGLLAEAEKREAGAEQDRMEFKPPISFDDFLKIDLRVAKVIAAETVKKAGKLLKLQLQVGSVTKQVLAGIARYYTPEEMVGKNVVLVANLVERTIRDDISEGMILAVEGADGKLFVIEPDGFEINGKQIQ